MRRHLVAGVGLLTAAAAMPAFAADIPVRAVYAAPPVLFSWTGFYVGINGGDGWGSKGVTIQPQTDPTLGLVGGPSNTLEISGGLAGGQAGFNYQIAGWVLGLEADAAWARLTGSNPCLFTSAAQGLLTCTASATVDTVGTLAGRLGIALERVLLYLKSGAVWTSDRYSGVVTSAVLAPAVSTTVTSPVLSPTVNASESRWGWMAGAGAEYAFAGPWSAKVEYNYMNLGSDHVTWTTVNGAPIQAKITQEVHVLKAGLNYRFGGPY
jgi:outer membrane immunogenic protein